MAPRRKDPTAAFLLAICIPGMGHVYAGAVAIGILLGVAIVAAWIVAGVDSTATLVPASAQILTAFHASRLVGDWNRANAPAPLPPPPPASMTAPRAVDPAWGAPPAPRAASPSPPPLAPLDPDAFLAEVRALWGRHRAGEIDSADFQRAKSQAIDRVRVADLEDGYALLEAASALVSAGVLTADERGRLQRQAASR